MMSLSVSECGVDLSCRVFSWSTFVLIKCDKICNVADRRIRWKHVLMRRAINMLRENIINFKHSKHFPKLETVFSI